jgi:hypothetical protein
VPFFDQLTKEEIHEFARALAEFFVDCGARRKAGPEKTKPAHPLVLVSHDEAFFGFMAGGARQFENLFVREDVAVCSHEFTSKNGRPRRESRLAMVREQGLRFFPVGIQTKHSSGSG